MSTLRIQDERVAVVTTVEGNAEVYGPIDLERMDAALVREWESEVLEQNPGCTINWTTVYSLDDVFPVEETT